MERKDMLKPITEWYAMVDYIEKKKVQYREGLDGRYYPDFSTVANSEEEIERMEDSYLRKFTIYTDFIRDYFEGVDINDEI